MREVRLIPVEGADARLAELVGMAGYDGEALMGVDEKVCLQESDSENPVAAATLLYIAHNSSGIIVSADDDYVEACAWRHVFVPWTRVYYVFARRAT